MIKAITIKPLDGDPKGTEREFDKPDFERLVALGAVRAAGEVEEEGEKSAPNVANKVAPSVANKAARKPADKAS
ncbi:hypothetical protein [Aureimonas sp. AU22]|uniref:hypothetical protein n=1 Tax=Aureimonas sp. AU22 TaxID=1638162 RepID=UPI00078266C9|nr:hypothetical protein [Aureimonas sp. AU22]